MGKVRMVMDCRYPSEGDSCTGQFYWVVVVLSSCNEQLYWAVVLSCCTEQMYWAIVLSSCTEQLLYWAVVLSSCCNEQLLYWAVVLSSCCTEQLYWAVVLSSCCTEQLYWEVRWLSDSEKRCVYVVVSQNISMLMFTGFNIQQFHVLPTQCIYGFCVDLRTNSDYFPIQH